MSLKKSKYREKQDRGDQMYGPGCCGHRITAAQCEAARARARSSDHKFWTPGWRGRGLKSI